MNPAWTDAEVAYLAGIIDGEGCFCLHNAGTHRFSGQLHIGNTDPRLMGWLHQHFGGTVRPERRKNPNHKSVFRWWANANDLSQIIQAILPFLVVKRHQAELMLAYRATLAPRIRTKRSTAKTSDVVKRERSRLHAELSILNRRGVA